MNIAVFSPSLYVHFEVPLRVQGAGCRIRVRAHLALFLLTKSRRGMGKRTVLTG